MTNSAVDYQRILDRYGLGILTEIMPLKQGYANDNTLLITDQCKVLYRICKQQPARLLAYEVRLMDLLKANRLKIAYPIADLEEEYIQSSKEGLVMLYEFKDGNEPPLSEATVQQIANEIGRLSTLNYPNHLVKKNAIHIEHCMSLLAQFEQCKNLMTDVFAYFTEQTNYLVENLDSSLPLGLVHGDVFPNNTIFQGNHLEAIIDFEEACTDHLLFDVAMTINGFCFKNNELQMDLLLAFLTAYQVQRPLRSAEWEQLPLYLQWTSHGMLSWHLKNDLIHTPNEEQLARVQELMQRTQWIRANEAKIAAEIGHLNRETMTPLS